MLNIETKLGTITITHAAIASLAAQAVMECYGVVGMAAPSLRDKLVERLQRDWSHRGIVIRQRDSTIAIDLYVILAHGVRISEVAQNIVDKVRFAIAHATGCSNAEVNVYVQQLQET